MTLAGKRVVITGGGAGIGAALAARFRQEGATVLTADLKNADVTYDVSHEDQLVSLITQAGEIDLFVSNAGIGIPGGAEVPDEGWERIWRINTMAHIWAARHLLPVWLERGHGYFLNTVSAAGLLMQIGSAPYSVTKHAALAFSEWLSVTYHDRGIRVSALCPQGVKTDMLKDAAEQGSGFLLQGAIEPEYLAEVTVAALAAEQFLILPHPEVAKYMQNRGTDHERWLRGMRNMQAQWPQA